MDQEISAEEMRKKKRKGQVSSDILFKKKVVQKGLNILLNSCRCRHTQAHLQTTAYECPISPEYDMSMLYLCFMLQLWPLNPYMAHHQDISKTISSYNFNLLCSWETTKLVGWWSANAASLVQQWYYWTPSHLKSDQLLPCKVSGNC